MESSVCIETVQFQYEEKISIETTNYVQNDLWQLLLQCQGSADLKYLRQPEVSLDLSMTSSVASKLKAHNEVCIATGWLLPL